MRPAGLAVRCSVQHMCGCQVMGVSEHSWVLLPCQHPLSVGGGAAAAWHDRVLPQPLPVSLRVLSSGMQFRKRLVGCMLLLCIMSWKAPAPSSSLWCAATQVRTYINGILYSALQRPVVRELAAARGLQHLLAAGGGWGMSMRGCSSSLHQHQMQ